jgi:hypothetical protein
MNTEDMIKREHEDKDEDSIPRKMTRRNSGEEPLSRRVTDTSLQRENFTLRNELHRLASEVASLKTFLVPKNCSSPSSSPNEDDNNNVSLVSRHGSSSASPPSLNPYGESRIRANSFLSSNTTSSDHNDDEEEEEDDVDVEEEEEDTLMEDDKEVSKQEEEKEGDCNHKRLSKKEGDEKDHLVRSSCESSPEEEHETHPSKRK